jgi:hypothetical protein
MGEVFLEQGLMASAKRATTRRMSFSKDSIRKRFPVGTISSVGAAGCGGTLALLLWLGCVEQSHDAQPNEEDITAARASLPKAPPTPRFPAQAVLENKGGGKITYLGLDADGDAVTAGQPIMITHYFRVDQPAPEGWRLFVHLDSPDKRAHLTADHVPLGGKYPVHRWQAGEIIRDTHKVIVPPSWPTDKLQLYVGLWKGGSRFTVTSGRQDGQNRVLAGELPVRGAAPPPPPKRLVVRKLKAGTTLTMDGKLDEPAWKDATSTGPFVNTMDGTPVGSAASARALWDDKNLYVAFEFQDADIYSAFEKHDDKLWTQDAAELFIDADGDRRTYVELQVSPRNVTFDSFLPNYRANDNAWDAPLVSGVQVSGTINKSDDNDTGWTVELQVPLTAARGKLEAMNNVPPAVGTQWRANFFRMDHRTGKPQAASGWSPPLVGDFHALDKFGLLVFADEQGSFAAPLPTPGAPTGAVPVMPRGGELPPALQRAMIANPKADPAAAKPAPTPTPAAEKPAVEKPATEKPATGAKKPAPPR